MGIMQDAGYLDGNGKLTPGAKEVFFRHREDIVNGVQNPLLPGCFISEKNENLIADARDEDQYYSFHVNWVNGMYNTCLKILDRESNISLLAPPDPAQPKGIIFDIVALSKKINKPIVTPIPPEQAGIPVIASLFVAPPPANLTLAAPFFGIADPVLLTEFITTTPTVAPGPYIPPIPSEFIPDIPSEAYPELEAPSLSSKQETLYTAVCQSLNILVAEINLFPATYITPLGVEAETTLKILYEKACSILSTTLPKPSVENAASFIVNFGTLQRSLTKPLALAALGTTIGSDKTGFIGRLKKVEPDAVGNYAKSSEKIGEESKALESMPKEGLPEKVNAIKTEVTSEEFISACVEAWYELYGEVPSFDTVAVAFGQCHVENYFNQSSGAFERLYNYNIGNLKFPEKVEEKLGLKYCQRKGTWEILNGVKVLLGEKSSGASFIAFDTLREAFIYQFQYLSKKYPAGFTQLKAGNPDSFAQALKKYSYYTGDEKAYAGGVRTGFFVTKKKFKNVYAAAAQNKNVNVAIV